jgi:hypothetical protein
VARGDSEIRVKIIGDAASLKGALATADQSIGGFALKAGGALLALGAVKQGFEFVGDSLGEADRLGDAMTRLELQLGGPLAADLASTADDFSKLGQSKQDVLELEAAFADVATTLGIADPTIADLADNVVATAAAVALLGDQKPDQVVDLIGKAAGGSERAAKELGVTLLDGVDATGQLTSILAQLKPKLDEATTSTQDLEGAQGEWDAKIETLQASLGEKLAPALASVLGFLNDEIDAIPGAIKGYEMLADAIVGTFEQILSPIARARDAVEGFLNLLGQATGAGGGASNAIDEIDVGRALTNAQERNNLQRSMGGP